MAIIPKGQELIRDFVDQAKWISSNSKMSMPGNNEKTVFSIIQVMNFFLLSFLFP